MRDDVIDLIRRSDDASRLTVDAQRIPTQEFFAVFAPCSVVSALVGVRPLFGCGDDVPLGAAWVRSVSRRAGRHGCRPDRSLADDLPRRHQPRALRRSPRENPRLMPGSRLLKLITPSVCRQRFDYAVWLPYGYYAHIRELYQNLSPKSPSKPLENSVLAGRDLTVEKALLAIVLALVLAHLATGVIDRAGFGQVAAALHTAPAKTD